MANNSLSARCKAASSLRITPSNSPVLRPPTRSSVHKTPLNQTTLSLQTVIGTTTTTPHGFSSHEESKSFALCAGSVVVLAELDDEHCVNQRFFRARPSAASVNPVTSFYSQSTPPTTPDSRAKFSGSIRSTTHSNAYNGSPSNDPVDNGSPRGWSSRERVKAVTSTAISPNGRFLAVGETGYSPRVLIFSTAKDASSEIPLSILTEHTFGVRGLAFSSDSQYLATLGDVNDGFLFVWSVNLKTGSAKLHSTNKCTSYVRDMCWMGQTLITVGVRHVKVWRLPDARPASPRSRLTVEAPSISPNHTPRAFSGRNCLLGSLAESTFTSVASISDRESVVGTDTGALCFVDDSEGSQKLSVVQHMEFGIASLAVDSYRSCVWVGGRGGQIQQCTFEKIRSSTVPLSPALSGRSSAEQGFKGPAIVCLGSLGSHLVTVDMTNAIDIYSSNNVSEDVDQRDAQNRICAHRDGVLGIRPLQTPNQLEADFFTWSRKGTVNFWNTQGKCKDSRTIALEHPAGNDEDISNELKVVRTTDDMDRFFSGDKFGVLRVLQGDSWKSVHEVRAHGGEITDIALHITPESCLVASSGRDRMVQLFERNNDKLQLIQTMDDHVGAVSQLLFIDDGEKLLSSSADRTIHVRDRVTREVDGEPVIAYLISRVITMKASPVSMTLSTDTDVLVVSTADRCILQYDLASGRQITSFRAIDSDGSDTVVMNSLTVASDMSGQSFSKLLVGVSGTDKSIRVYDLERGVLLTGEFGHTEGLSDACLLDHHSSSPASPNGRVLISSGLDGLVMIWGVSMLPQSSQDVAQAVIKDDDAPVKELTVAKPPLRKILSKHELAGLQRQENIAVTPTPARGHSPTFLRKFSKFSFSTSTKNGHTPPPTTPSSTSNRRSPVPSVRREKPHSSSPSLHTSKPAGMRKSGGRSDSRRSSLDFRARARNSGKSDFGSLDTSTEQVCRTLKAYRKKLNGSTEHVHAQKELERELSLTLRALTSRSHSSESAETETESSGKENEKLVGDGASNNTIYAPCSIPSPDERSNETPEASVGLSVHADGED
ncbi:WD40 repeat-like protein [Aspergillus sclerotioniger CBS 115572]|uniref:WD40 repeat-like protein n=1 Tax=Aspergillus sclerotioniger CBS 115572 TaxID=1450535 RepID=A0A317WYV6_9EURO|nr:WD40 repeat-like protein [Aspergillus sclerotioniger CBS 115572]PWY89400.1 WD40 repeat-like protein [Aspergillus sclerotioniger CBS 115572]